MTTTWETIMLLCGAILAAWYTPAAFADGRESLPFFAPLILVGLILGVGGALGLAGVI